MIVRDSDTAKYELNLVCPRCGAVITQYADTIPKIIPPWCSTVMNHAKGIKTSCPRITVDIVKVRDLETKEEYKGAEEIYNKFVSKENK